MWDLVRFANNPNFPTKWEIVKHEDTENMLIKTFNIDLSFLPTYLTYFPFFFVNCINNIKVNDIMTT